MNIEDQRPTERPRFLEISNDHIESNGATIGSGWGYRYRRIMCDDYIRLVTHDLKYFSYEVSS